MKKSVFIIIAFLIAGCLTLTHLSCSSSSDDDTGGIPAGTSQATLDEDTVTSALAFIEENVPGCTMDDSSAQQRTTVRSLLGLAGNISDNIVLHRYSQSTRTAAETETIPGQCSPDPGSLTMTINEDAQTGTMSGSFAFNNFCLPVDDGSGGQENLIVNGSVTFSGSVDPATEELQSLSVSTGSGGISVQIGSDMITASLSGFSVAVSGSTINIDMDSLTVSANVDGESSNVTVNDLDLTVVESDTYMEVDGSVTFVDQDGYLDIEVSDVQVNDESQVLSGEVTVSGANNTEIMITYQSATDDFLVEVDTTGDGNYDYQPGVMDCSELDVDDLTNLVGGIL